MIKTLVVAAVVAAPAALFAQPSADRSAEFTALTGRLEKAVLADDAAGITQVKTALEKHLAALSSSPNAPLVRYTIAYADLRLAFSPALKADEQTAVLADAEAQLKEALKANAQSGEAHALLGLVLGAQIAKNPDLGATNGPAVGEAIGRALDLAPDSPRVAVIHAQSLLHTPAEYGGSPQQAEAELRRAIQIFERQPAGGTWPDWGRFDAHAWLGQALAQRGDIAGARAEYKAALALAPENGWVKYVLMPQLK